MAPRKKNPAIKASGATSSKAAPLPDWVKGGGAKPPPPTGTNRDGSAQLFPPKYKTPLNIMYERIQKIPGWLKPEVEPFKRKDTYSCVITLRKENKQDRSHPHTLRMEPTEPGARLQCESGLHAKHWGATYVLFRLFNHLGLHRVLPPGPREYWLELEQVKAQSPPHEAWKWAADPFEAIAKRDADAEAREKEKAAREAARQDPAKRPVGKAWERALEVKMAPALRTLVESTIQARLGAAAAAPSVDTVTSDVANVRLDAAALEKELGKFGLRKGYVHRVVTWLQEMRAKYASAYAREELLQSHPLLASILSLPDREAAIEYIVLFTPEQDLPAQLRPTAASESFVTSAASGGGQEGLVDRWTVDKLSRCAGFPRENIERAITVARAAGYSDVAAREGVVLDILLHQLVGLLWEPPSDAPANVDERDRKQRDERELLVACTEENTVRPVSDKEAITDKDYDVYVGTYDGEDVALRVSLPPASRYLAEAGVWPTAYVTSTKLPAFLRLALTRHVLQCLRGERADIHEMLDMNEGGVLFLLLEELREYVPKMLPTPPPLDEVMEHLVVAAPSATARALEQRTPRAAPRTKSGTAPRAAPKLQRRAEVDASLKEALERWRTSVKYREGVAPVREALLAYLARHDLLEKLRAHRVVLITGETGCGKTTQVPQFLLDDAIEQGRGSMCQIVVTQPRRVSAMGVAARVSSERGESLDGAQVDAGALVGYAIRGEHRASRQCRLLFTTTGVLLRRLATGGDPMLQSVSHVVVDEVHERSTDSDFLLLLLRDVLQQNPHLRVVLMSATIQAETFIKYFDGAPHMHIPGRTFPVHDYYLEEIVQSTSYRSAQGYSRPDERVDRLYDASLVDEEAVPTLRALVSTQRTDYDLLAATVAHVAQRASKLDYTGTLRGRAAVLVFCPGVGEIRQAMDAIQRQRLPDVVLLPLHANLPPQEQRRVFQAVAKHERKVVIATNVAETSITIPDVCYVIDTGRVREAQYDAQAGVTRLLETWASQAACRQRAGRAGRTMSGECYRLFSRGMEAQVQRPFSVPEMQRTPLEGVVLQVKSIQPQSDVRAFLEKAIDPPPLAALEATHTRLVIAGALHAEGGFAAALTPLGRHLATLPLDVRLGKMLVMACLFECVEPLLHVVSLLSSRPIVAGAMQRDADAAKARAAYLLGQSDLLTDAHLFATWLAMRAGKAPMREQRQFCDKHGLSLQALQDVDLARSTLLRQLEEVGLVDRAYVQGYRAQGPRWPTEASALPLDRNMMHTNLLRALVLAGVWPSVARVDQPTAKYNASASGAVLKDANAKELHYFDEHDGRVFLHPSSMLFHATKFKSNYVAVFSKSASGAAGASRTYLRDATEVPLYALLLFGGPLSVDHHAGGIAISTGTAPSEHAWVRMRANTRIGVLCRQLRQLLDQALDAGVDDPHAWLSDANQAVVQAMTALLAQDGVV